MSFNLPGGSNRLSHSFSASSSSSSQRLPRRTQSEQNLRVARKALSVLTSKLMSSLATNGYKVAASCIQRIDTVAQQENPAENKTGKEEVLPAQTKDKDNDELMFEMEL